MYLINFNIYNEDMTDPKEQTRSFIETVFVKNLDEHLLSFSLDVL